MNGGLSPSGDKDALSGLLEENERLFGIRVQDLLTVDGELRAPQDVYRKVSALKLSVLSGSEETNTWSCSPTRVESSPHLFSITSKKRWQHLNSSIRRTK
jgi:hypothetical protein